VVQSQPRQIVCENLSRKSLSQKRAGEVALGEGPDFKPQYCTTKKKKKKGRKRKEKDADMMHVSITPTTWEAETRGSFEPRRSRPAWITSCILKIN
jgi:hypothetical protein